MGEATKIEWCHATFNPWWGCVRVSPGCEHCYAESFAKRVGQKVWGVNAERRFFGDKHWDEPLKWNREAEKAGERRRVFCASMADVFEDRDDLAPHRARLFALIRDTSHLDWLLLTKRPENAERLMPSAFWWPNIWLGTTAEDQKRADERIPELLKIPAAVHFVSYEPALEAVDFSRWMPWRIQTGPHHVHELPAEGGGRGIDWIIVGGESGPGARPFDIAWARSVVEQCKAAGIACFVKQLGAKPQFTPEPLSAGSIATIYGTLPVELALDSKKGGDMGEWPEDLRVRQFPEVRA